MNVGIIGIGYWGPNLVRNFYNNPKCKKLKISDLRQGRLEYIKNLFPDISISLNPAELLEDKELDAIVIATPVNTHKSLALEAMKFGKHVFIEKPLTDSYDDACELVEFAKSQGKIIAVGHIFQFAPSVIAIKNYIDNGKPGELFHFSSQRINLGPPHASIDVVWDLAPHDLSILLHLFGEYPNKINAYGESRWWNGIIDNAHIFMEFPSRRSAHVHVNWLSSNKTRRIMLFCSNGNFEYDETKGEEERVIFYDKGIDNRINQKDSEKTKLQYGVGEITKIKLPGGEPLALEVDAFLNSVKYGSEPVNNGEIGKEVVRILEIASHAIKEHVYA
jgi:predicted dehydrogenase